MSRKNYFVIRDIGIPPGLVNERRPHVKPGIERRIGKPSAAQPADITSARSNRPTVYAYDDKGEIDGIVQVPETWLVAGDMTDEGWMTDAEARNAFAIALADELGINPTALGENKLACVSMTHEEVLQMLVDEAELWGEA